MQRFRITLKSIGSGLLENRMPEDALLNLRDKTRKKSKSAARPSLEEEAEMKIHYNPDGHPCIPRANLLATLMSAGRFIRLDQKRQLSTKDSSLLPGLLFLFEESWPLLKPDSGDESTWGYASWRYDVRLGKNPNGGEAVCIVRPLFEQWAITFECVMDTQELPVDTYLKLFSLAGTRIGICDFRPACKGSFGQFAVTRWELVKEETPLEEVVGLAVAR